MYDLIIIHKRQSKVMVKKFISTLFCTFCLIPSFSQSWDEIKKNTDIFLFGEGWGATVEEADQQALSTLISKISVIVSSDFSISEDERTVNGMLDAESYTILKLQTYSTATLTNTERIVIENNDDDVHIGRYIKKTEINRIFEGRLRTVKEYVRLGIIAEEARKIDDALRNYYWAYSLLKSVQRPAEVTIQDEITGKDIHPLTWLPEKIKDIFDHLDVDVVANDGKNVDLMFKYKKNPVGSLDFSYFDGRNWSNICSVKNGRGTIEFAEGLVPENIQINYEYAYRGQAHINQEVKAVLDVVKGNALKGARINVKTGRLRESKNDETQIEVVVEEKKIEQQRKENISPVENEKPYREILSRVIYAIKNKSSKSVEDCFTEDGLDMFNRLIMYGQARIINTNECKLYQFFDNVIARSIQMSFTFRHGVRTNFVEDVVFTFNNEGKIDCVAFGLDKKAKEDIMNKNVWPVEARMTIIEFLENYKTAYSLKRLDYIRTIFDDDAVIIVGHVAKVAVRGNDNRHRTYRNKVTLTQYEKEQYIKHLEVCFRSNEFINIRFVDNDVRKAKEGEEYGIQIKQDYYSTNYGDEGYLYIQVDLNERQEPIIRVRTWQPQPDPEIGLFGLGNW